MKFAALATMALVASAVATAPAADKPRLPAGNAPVDKPTTAPADGETAELAGGQVRYVPLAGDWVHAAKDKTATRDAFISPSHDGAISIEVLPPGATAGPDLATALIKKLKEQRAANKQKILKQPTVEKDPRFLLKIREQFESKDKVADQLHLYRQVGKRVVMVTSNSLAGEDAAVKEHHEAAEKLAMSAEPGKPATKGPAGKGK